MKIDQTPTEEEKAISRKRFEKANKRWDAMVEKLRKENIEKKIEGNLWDSPNSRFESI